MTTTQKIILLGGAGLLYAVLSKAQTAGNLNFYPESVSDFAVTTKGPVMSVNVRVQNIGNRALTLRSMAGNVYANDFLIGNGENVTGLYVPGNSSIILRIQLNLSWFGIVQDIINAFNGNGLKQSVEWTPYVNIDGLPVTRTAIKFTVGS